MSEVVASAVAVVVGGRHDVLDDDWGEVTCVVRLDDDFPTEAFAGLEQFSHVRARCSRGDTGAGHQAGHAVEMQ